MTMLFLIPDKKYIKIVFMMILFLFNKEKNKKRVFTKGIVLLYIKNKEFHDKLINIQ